MSTPDFTVKVIQSGIDPVWIGVIGTLAGTIMGTVLTNMFHQRQEDRKAIEKYDFIIKKVMIANEDEDFDQNDELIQEERMKRVEIDHILSRIDKKIIEDIRVLMTLFNMRRIKYNMSYHNGILTDEDNYCEYQDINIKICKLSKEIHNKLSRRL